MEYHLEAEVVPPQEFPELDELQRHGVAALLDEQLDLLAGIEGPDGMEIEPLDHRVTARSVGASITWIVEAPALLFAEEAARHVLNELLERTELLSDWAVGRCEVTVSDDELATALAEPEDDAVDAETAGEDGDARRAHLIDGGERLRAFGADAFGADDGGGVAGGVDAEAALLVAGALVEAASMITEELFQDARTLDDTEETAAERDDLWVLPELPERFSAHYTARFAKRFLVVTTILGHRLARPEWTPPRCTAESLALHLVKSRAMQLLQLDDLLDDETIKRAFVAFDEHAFAGLDHESLYERANAADDDPAATAEVAGWFHPLDHVLIDPGDQL